MSDDFQDEIAFLGIEASPSFVRQPEATASPSASSGRWCATLRPSRSCAWCCSISPPGTTPTGWSPAMATGHLLRSGPTTTRPWIRPHEQRSRLSHNRGAVQREPTSAAACACPATPFRPSAIPADRTLDNAAGCATIPTVRPLPRSGDRQSHPANEDAGYTHYTPFRRQTTRRTPETSEGNQPRPRDVFGLSTPPTLSLASACVKGIPRL